MTGIAGGSWTMDDFYVMADVPTGVALTVYSGGGPEFRRTPFEDIVKLVENGALKVPLGKGLQLDEVRKAHEFMEKGGAGGKMVLMMP
jgi:NADPH2:quinone reductase